jgi:hypothetical protein
MDLSSSLAVEHLRACKLNLLARWRDLVRADPTLPERRLSFTEEELEDHLPSLFDALLKCLQGEPFDESEIRRRGAQHGTSRRIQGYSVTQLVWEFSIFRKLLRETLEQLNSEMSPESLFVVREAAVNLTDKSETPPLISEM